MRVSLFILVGFLFLLWCFGTVNGAEQFPNKPIRLISPQGPGSGNDLVSRIVKDPLSKIFGVPVVVENKPGGGSAIGSDYVVKSRPDGYTILSASAASVIIIPIINPTYKLEDLMPIGKVAWAAMVLSVRADSPFKTFEDLLDFTKKNPGKLTYASAGHGSITYFAIEILKWKAGADLTFVPTTAGTTNMTAILGGHVDVVMDSFGTQRGLIESGKIRPLAAVPGTRFLPNVPSFAEKGFPEAPGSFIGHFVPKGTPQPVIQKLMQALEKTTSTPSVISQTEKIGYQIDFVPTEKFSQEILTQYKTVEMVAKKVGLAK
ncbi:MAG: hypothetical protein A2162_10130 [Deltaproteobacteria bacterium RBG_13_52_11b]|nr:MAG: hypothetical protein A2162_10130 [Deltaproteobacteria bacterium RBG_13_52_11b]